MLAEMQLVEQPVPVVVKDGTFDTLFEHWILGQNAVPRQPRWPIVRDVLHWLD